jgi:hypothetical protein
VYDILVNNNTLYLFELSVEGYIGIYKKKLLILYEFLSIYKYFTNIVILNVIDVQYIN